MSEQSSVERRGEAAIVQLSERPSADNRRSHPRFAVEVEVGIHTDHNFYAGFSENLSEGGLFVATHRIQPVGSLVEISITVPSSEQPIRARGEVRWLRSYNEASDAPPGMGIRFVELDVASSESIQGFLTHRDPLFYDDD